MVQYGQETGRGRQSGYPSVALLLYGKTGKHLQKSIKYYCANSTECYCNMLFRKFLFYTANEDNANAVTFVKNGVSVQIVNNILNPLMVYGGLT